MTKKQHWLRLARLLLGTTPLLGVALITAAPVVADSASWDWVAGDCGGSPGGLLSDQTVDVEPGSSVCVLPPSYQMTAGPRLYVGVEIEGQYFPETSEADLRCRTAVVSSVLVHSATSCTVEPGRLSGRIDFSPEAVRTLYVDHEAPGLNDGSSWADAYTDLTTALTASVSGDHIWVAEGVYKPGGPSPSRTSTFTLKDGVKIYGGFDGTETVRSARDPSAHPTILSGDIGTGGVPTDNVYHVVHAQSAFSTALLDGFTVTGGYANGAPRNDSGGGLFAYFGSPTIVNVDFVDNYAIYGGGIYNSGAPITVVNSGFYGNEAGTATAFGLGGGFYGGGTGEKLINSTFSGNVSQWQGGGAYWASGSFGATLRNLAFTGNSTISNTGGAMYISNTLPLISPWTIANVVLWGNTWGSSPNQLTVVAGPSPTTISYSLIEGGWAAGSNILDADPLFVDADGDDNTVGTADDNLRLQLTSPAIDAGDNGAVLSDGTDLDGDGNTSEVLPLDADYRSRFYDVASKLDTGAGTPPIVDMGAYEAIDAVDADLSIDKSDSFVDCVPGAPVSYWIQAVNEASEAVISATVSDTFSVELSGCDWSCTADGGATCTASGTGDINDTVDLPVGASVTYIVDCTLSLSATGTLSNTATVSVPTGYTDTNPSDNTATDVDTVLTLGSCGAPDNRDLEGVDVYGTVVIEACVSISARDTVIIGDTRFKAGQSIVLEEGFMVESGGSFEAEINMP